MAGKFRKIQAMFWPVTVRLAKGKNKFDQEKIEVKYERLEKDDLKDFFARYLAPEDASPGEKAELHQGMLDEIFNDYVLDWKIDGEDGEPMPFDGHNLDLVIAHPDYHAAIVTGFMEVQQGGAAKN